MSRKRGSLSRSKLAVLLSFATIANLSGCGQKELETGPVRQYESEERIAVNLFCDEAISSGIWSEPITSKDGTRIQIIDEAASYYNEEGTGHIAVFCATACRIPRRLIYISLQQKM